MADYGSRGLNGSSPLNDITQYGDEGFMPDMDGAKRTSPLEEIGTSGLKRATGIIDEEFLPALRGRKALKVFREMSLNDPIVGAMLFAIDKLVRQVTWRVEPPDQTPDGTKAADFLESCMDDMSHTWNDMISEILSMLAYGFSWHEIIYKKRVGPWEKDPKKRSKYADGMIGWRKIPIRSQETLLRWVFDDTGGVQAFVQIAPPYYKVNVLPISRSLLFRTGQHKGNPEGLSVLRNAYRPWFFKKRLEEFEAIGVERDLAGLPVAKVPSSYMNSRAGSKEDLVYKAFKKMVQNVRRDEHEGLVLPLEYDQVTKQPMFEFELLSSGGARTFDTNALIQRYEQRILMSTLADFILVGHEGEGSYAMHVDKTGIFRATLNVITDAIADVFNRHAIPRLFEINSWKLDELPKIVPNNVDPPNLSELAQFMTAMGGLGMQFFPDPDLEKFLRETAHLPELPDDVVEMQRMQAQQQQQMQMMGSDMKHQAVMSGQMTPEQAQLASENPNPEMQANDAVAQAVGQARGQMHPEVQQATAQQMEQQKEMDAQALAAKQGDPVGEHTATAQVDEQRAAADHARSLEQAKTQDQLKDKDAKRTDQMSAKEHQRQIMLEKIKAKANQDKTKGQVDLQRVKASTLKKKPEKKPKR